MSGDSRGTLGDRLRIVRGSITQAEFARRFAVSNRTLGLYERNVTAPDAKFLGKIASDLDVDLNWLVLGRGEMRQTESAAPSGGLKRGLMEQAIRVSEQFFRDEAPEISPSDRAKMILLVYELVAEIPEEKREEALEGMMRKFFEP